MNTRTARLPKKYHDAVVKWRETYLPDFDLLIDNWDRFFPKDPTFELCAYRELGMCSEIECGAQKGKSKYLRAKEMHPTQAGHMLGAVRAQASTEFGSIQQHQLTLSRAQDERDQFWILRMMAEELRHGYQMLHLLVEDDWAEVSDTGSSEMVEEILSMRTGSHILGAFNIDFDSFVDSVVFCAVIDRVGKYQLQMQKVSAYKPMAESMPQMLREEAFHLAAGVVPMRRWVAEAATGSHYVTMDDLQRTLNKWIPRGLEMFGDERGGGTNVRYGLKPMKNAEAQEQYYEELAKLIRDLNVRFVRARLPELDPDAVDRLIDDLESDGGRRQGIDADELLRMPHAEFFRRRGVPAFRKVGVAGEEYETADAYLDHLTDHLPSAYRAGVDFLGYVELLEKVEAGELEPDEAARQSPTLRRVGGVCPCSRAVRWVAGEASNGDGAAV